MIIDFKIANWLRSPNYIIKGGNNAIFEITIHIVVLINYHKNHTCITYLFFNYLGLIKYCLGYYMTQLHYYKIHILFSQIFPCEIHKKYHKSCIILLSF